MSEAAYVAFLVISAASVLVLVSLGLSIIFGVLGVINFAQGEFITIGAFATISCHEIGLSLWQGMLVATVITALIAVACERLILYRLYGRLESTMLATWGLSIILVQILLDLYGTSTPGLPQPFGAVDVGIFSIPVYSLVLIGAAVILLAITYVCFNYTPYGVIARAVVQDRDTAAAMGINSSAVYALTFTFGGALAGLGGALIAPTVAVTATMGQSYLGQAFMAIVVGGSGVVSGTAAASVLLEAPAQVAGFWTSAVIGVLVLFGVAIALLRVLPTGITGKLGLTL